MNIGGTYVVSYPSKNCGLIRLIRDYDKGDDGTYEFDSFKDAVRFAKHRHYDNENLNYDFENLSYPEECYLLKEVYGKDSYQKLVTDLRHSGYVNTPRPDFGNIDAAYNIMVTDLASLGYVDIISATDSEIMESFYEHKEELQKENMIRRGFSLYVNNMQLPDVSYVDTEDSYNFA